MSVKTNAIVSSDSEQLILVDEQDQVVGYEEKGSCHDGEGVLHRAFSLFVFNSNEELLLQRRAADKRLWPMYWSNTCCSHPRKGESMEIATQRRLQEELGMQCELTFEYKFQYHALFEEIGAERELCSVYSGISDATAVPNVHEVAEHRWVSVQQIDKELEESPHLFTPWFKLEWTQIRRRL